MIRDSNLLRNWRFQALWIGACSAIVGTQIVTIAYPLLILAITGSAGLAGVFSAVQLFTAILVGIPAGSIIDRYDRRGILVASEVIRILAALTVMAAIAMHDISYIHLLIVAALSGVVQPFVGSVRILATRAVVSPEELPAALGQEQVRDYAAQLLGPSIGGSLFSFGRTLPFFANAVGFVISLASAVIVRFDSPRRTRAEQRQNGEGVSSVGIEGDLAVQEASSPNQGLLAGLSLLWHDRLLRTVLISIMTVNLIVNPLDLATIVLARHDGVSNSYVGMIFAGFALGGLLGAPLVSRIHSVLLPGRLLIVVLAVFSAGVAAMAVPLGAVWLAGCLMVAGIGVPALLVLLDILIFNKVADEMRGRVITATTTLMVAGQPAGSVLGGLSLQYLSPTTTVLAMALGIAATVALIIPRRELHAATWPS